MRVRGAGRRRAGAVLCVRPAGRAAVRPGYGRRAPRSGGLPGSMEELSSVGEQVFAAECILSKRLRKVRAARPAPSRRLPPVWLTAPLLSPQGKLEYLVKWRGWSSK